MVSYIMIPLLKMNSENILARMELLGRNKDLSDL